MESFDIKISHIAAMEMYEDNMEFFFTDMEYALEAEGSEEGSNANNTESWIQKFIAKIVAMIKNGMVRMSNWFERIMETDSGFEKELRMAELGKKPREKVSVIGYKYVDNVISSAYTKIKQATNEYVNRLGKADITIEDSELTAKSNDIVKDIIKQLGSNMDDPSRYFDELTRKFRGQKVELNIPKTAIPNYMKTYRIHRQFNAIIQKDMENLLHVIRTVETNLRHQASKINYNYKTAVKNTPNGENKPEKPTHYLKKYLNNLMKIYNFNVSFCNFALSLKTEQALAARAVLKRFFDIGLVN